MRRPLYLNLTLLLVVVVAAMVMPLQTTSADVVKLRTGESIKGRPLAERSDETVLVVEDFLSGAVRTLSWEVVDPADRDRLQEAWGWKNKAMQTVKGHRLVQQLQGGATEPVRGLIQEETTTHYHVLRGGKVIKVPKEQVVEVDEEEMDPRDIWSPEQLVARFMDELKKNGADINNLSSRESFRIAEYAEKSGAFETAKKHYEICANDSEFLLAQVARQRLERVEALLRDAAALKGLRDIRLALSLKSFRRVREMLEAFPEEHPDASEPIKKRLEKTDKDFKKKRAEYFQLEAKINFPKFVLKMIKSKVQEKDIGLSDATAWTRRELPEEAFKGLAARLNKRDDVTADEARIFWENRKKSGWKTATYGAGTFIVDPPKIKPPKRKRNNNRRRGGGAAPTIEIPKPPTRDGWWAKAGVKERQSWVMAFFVENSGLFEVSDRIKYSLCMICNGTGLETKNLSGGGQLSYLCTRCGGAQRDKRVQYR